MYPERCSQISVPLKNGPHLNEPLKSVPLKNGLEITDEWTPIKCAPQNALLNLCPLIRQRSSRKNVCFPFQTLPALDVLNITVFRYFV